MSSVISFRRPLSAIGADGAKISILPAWVVRVAELCRDCFDLERAGWQLHLLEIGDVRQVLFSHPQVHTVPARFLTVAEAKKEQAALARLAA